MPPASGVGARPASPEILRRYAGSSSLTRKRAAESLPCCFGHDADDAEKIRHIRVIRGHPPRFLCAGLAYLARRNAWRDLGLIVRIG